MRTRATLPPADPRLQVFGQLATLVAAPDITDVFVNDRSVWVIDAAGLRQVPVWLGESAETLARRLVGASGRHVDEVTPIAGADLAGMRIQVVLPPVSQSGVLIAIRKPCATIASLEDLELGGTLTPRQRAFLQSVVDGRQNVLISGGTGAGKTTLLRAMMATTPAHARIITIEDVAELGVPHPHALSLQARQPNIQGAGAIPLAELVAAALRMRPDWLLVGECRGVELAAFLSALNTGHAGGGTIHASSLEHVPARLEMLGTLSNLSNDTVARQAGTAFHWLVHLDVTAGGSRSARIARISLAQSELLLTEVTDDVERGLV